MKYKSILAAAACCCALVASAAERTWDGGETYVFAEVADGSDATLDGIPALEGGVCSNWRLKLSEDKKKILAVPPGLIIISK